MTEVAVRPYTAADIEACRELWRELTQRHRDIYEDQAIGGDDPGPQFDEHLGRPDLAGVWLAERAGVVLGLVGLLVDGEQGEVEPIVVTSRERSRGTGRLLLQHAIDEAQARGVRFLSVRPVARNVEAIALFHETGFRTLGHLDMFMDLAPEQGRTWKSGVSVHGRDFQY